MARAATTRQELARGKQLAALSSSVSQNLTRFSSQLRKGELVHTKDVEELAATFSRMLLVAAQHMSW